MSDNVDLEILAAQLRRHTDDLSLYGGMLINVLSAALPAHLVQVRREGKWKARLDSSGAGGARRLGHRWRAALRARPRRGRRAPITKICHQSGGVVMSTGPCRPTSGAGSWPGRSPGGRYQPGRPGHAAAFQPLSARLVATARSLATTSGKVWPTAGRVVSRSAA